MPTSAPGSSHSPRWSVRRAGARGFTVVELLIVIAIMAVALALVSWALPDSEASRLEEEGERLSALLEMARAEARVSGLPVFWTPTAGAQTSPSADGKPVHFRFAGLRSATALPSRWLDERISAEVVGAAAVVLGPEAILPAQRIVLHLADKRLELASDGLAPFAVAQAPGGEPESPPPRP